MALLAERKQKQKVGLDPLNKQWLEDDNKFGKRLMQKMGWEQGKGLGAKESGSVDCIKSSFKFDMRGLGFTLNSGDAWISHQDDLNDILQSLNKGKEEVNAPENISDGKKRYLGKFARGRVPTLRSTNDLDCILGRRKTTSDSPKPDSNLSENSSESSQLEEGDNRQEKSHGLVTVTSQSSVQDYFAMKMAKLKAKRMNGSSNLESDVNPDSSGQRTSCEKRGEHSAVSFNYDDMISVADEDDSKKQNNKSSDSLSTKSGCYKASVDENNVKTHEHLESDISNEKKKKSKKRKRKECEKESMEEDTNDCVSDKPKKKKEKVKENTRNNSVKVPLEKKKKKVKENTCNNSVEVQPEKKKEKVKENTCNDNIGVLILKEKKSRKRKRDAEKIETDGGENNNEQITKDRDSKDVSSKKRKKKKDKNKEKEKTGDLAKVEAEPSLESIGDGSTENEKRKKKKKSIKKGKHEVSTFQERAKAKYFDKKDSQSLTHGFRGSNVIDISGYKYFNKN